MRLLPCLGSLFLLLSAPLPFVPARSLRSTTTWASPSHGLVPSWRSQPSFCCTPPLLFAGLQDRRPHGHSHLRAHRRRPHPLPLHAQRVPQPQVGWRASRGGNGARKGGGGKRKPPLHAPLSCLGSRGPLPPATFTILPPSIHTHLPFAPCSPHVSGLSTSRPCRWAAWCGSWPTRRRSARSAPGSGPTAWGSWWRGWTSRVRAAHALHVAHAVLACMACAALRQARHCFGALLRPAGHKQAC